MKRTTIALSLAALTLACSAPAAATPKQEDAIYELTINIGVTVAGNEPDMAEAICQDVGAGATPLGEAAWIAQNIPGERFSYTQAKQFVFGALNVYCPDVS